MRKIIVATLLCLVALSASAQKFGIQAGVILSDMKMSGSSAEEKFNSKAGFSAGATLDFKLIAGLGLNTGLFYVERKSTINDGTSDLEFKASSLELPLNLTWGINLPVIRPFITAGPYLDYGLEAKFDGEKLEYGKDKDLERMQYGLNLGAGIDLFKTLRVMYQYDLGLSDWDSASEVKTKVKGHRVSVAILF